MPRDFLTQGGLREPIYLQDKDQIRVLAADDPNQVSPAFAYVGGEVVAPQRVSLPHQQNQPVMLADVLFEAKGWVKHSADPRHIYVIRHGGFGQQTPGSETCDQISQTKPQICALIYQLNLSQAGNFVMATQFPMQNRDFVFVAAKPITRWNSALAKIMPTVSGLATLSQALDKVR